MAEPDKPQQSPPSDAELLSAWQAGQKAEGNRLFQRHVRSINRFFRTKVPGNAEDLTQRTFLALVEGADRFRCDSSFRTYLYAIAHRQLLMHLRSRHAKLGSFDPLVRSVVDAGASPSRVAAKHQQRELVAHALQRIPAAYQVALELHYFEEMPLAAIAEIQQDKIGTIKSRLSRGRVLLREQLEALAEPGELLSSTVGELDRWLRSLPDEIRGPDRPQ